MEVSLRTIEHTELPGAGSWPCATHHFALLAQRALAPHELRMTVENGGNDGKLAVLISLASQSADGQRRRRVQHLKDISIDNKRMV